MIDSTRRNILQSVKSLGGQDNPLRVKDLLSPERLRDFQVNTEFVSYDYSKQRITKDILKELLLIPEKVDLKKSINDIFQGKNLNPTEKRRVSHILHRNSGNSDLPEIGKILKQHNDFNYFINHRDSRFNSTIESIISISIGGSRLGPEMLSEVFYDPEHTPLVHYCSSYDLKEIENAMHLSDPSKTILIVSSKSFNTEEIMVNFNRAKSWLKLGSDDFRDRIIGISANKKAMSDFEIKEDNQFTILDSLGGRYSIWSSISMPAVITMGSEKFEDLKAGAREADKHFIERPWGQNIPVLMALLSCWNMNGLGISNLGIFTYDFKIRSLVKYFSQMGMESNGKSFNEKNTKSFFDTCPLIWGGYGPEAQHSVFQWLLQGSYYSACDFIGIKDNLSGTSNSYQMLLAQAAALSIGKEDNENKYKSVEGNNPISLFKLDELDPKSLGFLIATYEHKVFVESQIYGINPFDQWGVQLGKEFLTTSNRSKLMSKFFDPKFLS